MTARTRALIDLVGPTVRRAPWGTVGGCIAVAVAVTWVVASREVATTGQVITTLRWAAVLLTTGVAAVLDDPTEDDLAGAGLPVAHRRAVALLVVATPTAVAWALALTIGDLALPWAALTLEAAALLLCGVAVASARPVRSSTAPGGLVGAAVPAVALLLAPLLPPAIALLADPGDVDAWRDAHRRWAVLALAAAGAALLAARDPARRPPWRTAHPTHPRRRRPADHLEAS